MGGIRSACLLRARVEASKLSRASLVSTASRAISSRAPSQ